MERPAKIRVTAVSTVIDGVAYKRGAVVDLPLEAARGLCGLNKAAMVGLPDIVEGKTESMAAKPGSGGPEKSPPSRRAKRRGG